MISGEQRGIRWRKKTWSYDPRWIYLVLLTLPLLSCLSLLIALVLQRLYRREVVMELPFNESAWAAWQAIRVGGGVGGLVAVLGSIGGVALLLQTEEPAIAIATGGLSLLVGFAAVIAAERRSPRVTRITDEWIELRVPSAAAARRIELHLEGRVETEVLDGTPCATHAEAAATGVCRRCGAFACSRCSPLCGACARTREQELGGTGLIEPTPRRDRAGAAFILGAMALVPFVAIVCGPLAIGLGWVEDRDSVERTGKHRVKALLAIGMGVLGLLGTVGMVLLIAFGA